VRFIRIVCDHPPAPNYGMGLFFFTGVVMYVVLVLGGYDHSRLQIKITYELTFVFRTDTIKMEGD
jgi:hypothetical protein